jgi:hypothetical protein
MHFLFKKYIRKKSELPHGEGQFTYSLTHSLFAWKTGSHSACQKISCFFMDPKVHYRVHKSPPLDPILSQLNPISLIDPYLLKVQLNVILPPTPTSSQWSLTFGPVTVIKGKVKVKLSLRFHWAPRCQDILGSGGIAPRILWFRC